MHSIALDYKEAEKQASSLRDTFMGWQCRVRQIAMRNNLGRPDYGVTPHAYLEPNKEPLGQIVTVICKSQSYSKIPELQHIYKITNDPAQRRDKAVQLFSDTYYQKHQEFSDRLMATFKPNSYEVKVLGKLGACRLEFAAYGHQFTLKCKVNNLEKLHPNYIATWWHNVLFNPNLNPNTKILEFEPDWKNCSMFRDRDGTI